MSIGELMQSLLVNTILYHYKEALISKNNSWFFYIFLQCLRRMHLPRLLRSHQGTIIYQNMTKCRDRRLRSRYIWFQAMMMPYHAYAWVDDPVADEEWTEQYEENMTANEIIKDEMLKRLHETAKLYEW